MRSILASILTLALMFATAPATAAETIEAPYYGGGARVLGVGPSFLWGGDLTGDGEDDTPRIGGAQLDPVSLYVNVVVSASDDVYGSNVAFVVYMWDPSDDEVVQEPYSTGTGCGGRTLTGSPYATNQVSVHTLSLAVTEDLDVCGASAGTLTADYF